MNTRVWAYKRTAETEYYEVFKQLQLMFDRDRATNSVVVRVMTKDGNKLLGTYDIKIAEGVFNVILEDCHVEST